MTVPTCKSCPYWVHDKHDDFDGMHPHFPDLAIGECRRYPPPAESQVRPDLLAAKSGTIDMGVWVKTIEDEWCGEHPDFPEYLDSLRMRR